MDSTSTTFYSLLLHLAYNMHDGPVGLFFVLLLLTDLNNLYSVVTRINICVYLAQSSQVYSFTLRCQLPQYRATASRCIVVWPVVTFYRRERRPLKWFWFG